MDIFEWNCKVSVILTWTNSFCRYLDLGQLFESSHSRDICSDYHFPIFFGYKHGAKGSEDCCSGGKIIEMKYVDNVNQIHRGMD